MALLTVIFLSVAGGISFWSGPMQADSGKCAKVVVWSGPKVESSQLSSDSGFRAERGQITKSRMNLIAIAAAWYCEVNSGRVPLSVDSLLSFAAQERTQGHSACLLVKEYLVDGWDRPFIVNWGGIAPAITSLGPDGKSHSVDDIVTPGLGQPGTSQIDARVACSPSSSHQDN